MRQKTQKKKKNYPKETLIAQHKKKVNELMSQKKKLPSYQKEIKKLEKKLEDIKNQNNGFGMINNSNTRKIYQINEKICELKKIIKKINNDDLITDYFLKTGHIIHEYYNIGRKSNKQIPDKLCSSEVKLVDSKLVNSKLVDSKLVNPKLVNSKKSSNKESKSERKISISSKKHVSLRKKLGSISRKKFDDKKNSYSAMKLSDFFKIKNTSNRIDLLDQYTGIINPRNYRPKLVKKKIEIEMCKRCNVEMTLIQSEGIVVCTKCGREKIILIDSDKPSYKDPPPEAGEFTYKRIGRFDEWLTQYQARETTEIPQEVLDGIYGEIKKERITNMCNITIEKVRGFLKKLGMNKYYENVPHIIQRLNGLETPRLNPQTEEKLRSMFRQIQDIFPLVCPNTRTNFLSYAYLLRKLLELLGEHQHKQYFRLHKSREKIYNHDKIWEKICKILNWEYIKTV